MTDQERQGVGYTEASEGFFRDFIAQTGIDDVDPGQRAGLYSLLATHIIEDASKLEDAELLLMSHGIFEDEEARRWVHGNMDEASIERYDKLVSPEMVASQSGTWEGRSEWFQFGDAFRMLGSLLPGVGEYEGTSSKRWVEGSIKPADQTLLTLAIREDPHWSQRWAKTTAEVGTWITGAMLGVGVASASLPAASRGVQFLRMTRFGGLSASAAQRIGAVWSNKYMTMARWGTGGAALTSQVASILFNAFDPEGMEAAELEAELDRQAREEGLDIQSAPLEYQGQPIAASAAPGMAEGVQALPAETQSAMASFQQMAQDTPTRPGTSAPADLLETMEQAAAGAEDDEPAPDPYFGLIGRGGVEDPYIGGFSETYTKEVPGMTTSPGASPRVTIDRRTPEYRDSDYEKILSSWTPADLEKFQSMAVRAGLIDPEGRAGGAAFSPGYKDAQTREALGVVLVESNANFANYWSTLRRLADEGDKLAEEEKQRAPFHRGTYVAPDYSTLSQDVVGNVERRLGRKASKSEITLLANQLLAEHREYFEDVEAARYSDYVAEGRAEEYGEEAFGGDAPYEEFDMAASFEEKFREQYQPELDAVESSDKVRAQMQNMMNGLNQWSSAMGG